MSKDHNLNTNEITNNFNSNIILNDDKSAYSGIVLSVDEQIELLQERGMIINNINFARKFLEEVYFHRFWSYAVPFMDQHDHSIFLQNVKFEDVINVYHFDHSLRQLIFSSIELIEIAVRTSFIDLANKHGAHFYLNDTLFNDKTLFKYSLEKIDRQIENSDELLIEEYYIKYSTPNYPPIWRVIELFSIGQLSKWYANLKNSVDKIKIADNFNIDYGVLEYFLHNLTLIRNYCAHHGRIWNRKFLLITTRRPKKPKVLEKAFQPNNKRIYNIIILITYMLKQLGHHHYWYNSLVKLITKYKIDTDLMGFPENWEYKLRSIVKEDLDE